MFRNVIAVAVATMLTSGFAHAGEEGGHKPVDPGQLHNTNKNYNSNWNKNSNSNKNSNANYNQNYNSNRANAKASANADASSKSASNSSSSSGGNDLSSSQGNDQSMGGDDYDSKALGVSYTDTQPEAPMAAVSQDAVVTTWGVKVLGPVFGMTDQDITWTAKALSDMSNVVQTASTNDHTPVGRSMQSSTLATLCTFQKKVVEYRFGDGACDRIGEIVDSTN